MGSNVFGRIQFLQIIVGGGFAMVATVILFTSRAHAVVALAVYAFAAFAWLMFEWRKRGLRRSIARVSQELEAVRAQDLESATPLGERGPDELAEEIAANRAFANMVRGRSVRIFSRGGWQGHRLDIGTAIIAGRDLDVMVSHVLVERPGLPRFRLMTRGAVTRLSRLTMRTAETKTGDAAFDAAWVIDADHALATAVLDQGLRRTLLDLPQRIPWMSVASLESTEHGLIVRWPGELSAASAAALRDLAIDVAVRLAG